jgi:hypothetical protein
MTAHRGYDKRLRPSIRERAERAGNNLLQICDATASNGNCDPIANLNLFEYFCRKKLAGPDFLFVGT